ncbi:MAG: tyrosine-type recombinase/integrase [Streptosporangiaceae bacterium]
MHQLRHHFASLLLRGGVDIKRVQDWLGHHSAAFTLDISVTSHARRSRGVAAAGRGNIRHGPPFGTGRPSCGPAWRGRQLRARSRRSDNSRTLPVVTWAGT